ncbi:MAG TPA: hypothetical protein VE974_06965 [Thermoanaerobaculia bacterium]|nr:hypothetical protein [Thermoanaerobaculia bacterium]
MPILIGDPFDQGFQRDRRFSGNDDQLPRFDGQIHRGVLLLIDRYTQTAEES